MVRGSLFGSAHLETGHVAPITLIGNRGIHPGKPLWGGQIPTDARGMPRHAAKRDPAKPPLGFNRVALAERESKKRELSTRWLLTMKLILIYI